MAADRTPLGTGIPAIDRDQAAPVPAGLVREHAQQFPPAHIGDGFGQAVILQQVFDGQRLDTDHLVLADESGRQLVLEITAAIGNAGMDASDLAVGLSPGSCSPFCFLAWRRWARASRFSSCRKKCSLPVFSPVESVTTSSSPRSIPTVLDDAGQGGDVLLHQEGDKVPSSGITTEGDGARPGILGQGTTPANGQGLLHARQRQGAAIPGEGRGGVLGRLAAMLLLERRILRPPVKEVAERFVQVPQGLLGWDTGDLIQPAIVWLLFELGQGGAGVAVEEVFPALAVGIGAQAQAPVVHETRTAERPSEQSGAGSASGSSGTGRRVSVAYGSLLFQPRPNRQAKGGRGSSRSHQWDGCPPRKKSMNKRGSVWQTVKALFLPEGMEQVAKRMRERQKSNQQTKASHISRRSLLFPWLGVPGSPVSVHQRSARRRRHCT